MVWAQEDEADQLKRTQAAEEQDIDVGLGGGTAPAAAHSIDTVQTFDGRAEEWAEDAAWAEEEPDGDAAGWRMRVIMEEDGELMSELFHIY